MKKKGSFGGGPNEPTEWQESREWKYSIHFISQILHKRDQLVTCSGSSVQKPTDPRTGQFT